MEYCGSVTGLFVQNPQNPLCSLYHMGNLQERKPHQCLSLFLKYFQLHLKSMDIRPYDVSMLSCGQNTPNLEISFKVIFSELELMHGNKSSRRDRSKWMGGAAPNGPPEARLGLRLWERVFIWLEESAGFFFLFFRKVIWILI